MGLMLSFMSYFQCTKSRTFRTSLIADMVFIAMMRTIMNYLLLFHLLLALHNFRILFVNLIRKFRTILSSPFFNNFCICAYLTYALLFAFILTLMCLIAANMVFMNFIMQFVTIINAFFILIKIIIIEIAQFRALYLFALMDSMII